MREAPCLLMIGVMLFAVGCTPPPATDAGTDAGSDAACNFDFSDVPSPTTRCPAAPPEIGSPCGEGLLCSWGTEPSLSCRTASACECGRWASVPLTGCVHGANVGCPATPPMAGSSCLGDAGPISDPCQYSDGSQCSCSDFDHAWACTVIAAGCPHDAPNLGTDCPTEGLDCLYSGRTCATRIHCTSGTWRAIRGLCGG